MRRIIEAIAAIAYQPEMGRVSTDQATRELVASGTPYIAVYRLRARIEIVAIFHASRRWPVTSGLS